MRPDPTVAAAVADAHRREWAFVLAATVRVTRDIDLAEECVQDAYARALSTWPHAGVPDRPGLWLSTVARRRAVDLLRREGTLRKYLPLLVEDDVAYGPDQSAGSPGIPDDRLRLIFVCCHPALSRETQVALTLKLVCGLSTNDIARAFLVKEATMAARLTRGKAKIARAVIPYREPPSGELPERVESVLDVVNLLFTTGHTAPAGAELVRGELITRATDLARLLHRLLPEIPAVAGLLALILLTDARRDARTDAHGRLRLLADQDRTRWDPNRIQEGLTLVRRALRARPPHRFALMAAIAAVHAESPDWERTDWQEIVGLYDVLLQTWPSPVVALNRAIAVGFAYGPERGLSVLEDLAVEPQLAVYPYLAAARADLLRRLGRVVDARVAYEEALHLTDNDVERRYLDERLRSLAGPAV